MEMKFNINQLRKLTQAKKRKVASLEKDLKQYEELLYTTLVKEYEKLESYEQDLNNQIEKVLDETESLLSQEENDSITSNSSTSSVEDNSKRSDSTVTIHESSNEIKDKTVEELYTSRSDEEFDSSKELELTDNKVEETKESLVSPGQALVCSQHNIAEQNSYRAPNLLTLEDLGREEDLYIENNDSNKLDSIDDHQIQTLYVDTQHVLQEEDGKLYVLNDNNRKRYVQLYKDSNGQDKLTYIDNG